MRWTTLADLSNETRDRSDAYIELQQPQQFRFVRYKHKHVGANHLAISDLAAGYDGQWGSTALDQRFADQPTSFTLRSLNRDVRYVLAAEAFDERGVSPLSQVVEIAP